MRIVQVAHGFPPIEHAGAELCAYYLARELGRRGHDVRAFVSTSREDQTSYEVRDEEVDGISVSRIRTPADRAPSLERLYLDPRVRDRFVEWLGDGVDVVHIHHLAGLSVDLVEAARSAGARVVLTLHDFWYQCPRGQRLTPRNHLCTEIEPWRCSLCIGKKRLRYALNSWTETGARNLARPLSSLRRLSSYVRDNALTRPIDLRRERILEQLRVADAILSPSAFVLEEHRRLGLEHEQMIHSDNGVEVDWLDRLPPLEQPRTPMRFSYMGSFLPSKGVETLLEASQFLAPTELQLHLHGTSPWDGGAYAERLRRRYQSDAVVFHGPFGRDALVDVLAETDVLVVPSRWYENAPLTMDEAALARRPIIASGHGGMKEAIEERGNGITFQPDDAADLARAMKRFSEEPELWAKLREPEKAVRTVGDQADEMETLYRSLAGG